MKPIVACVNSDKLPATTLALHKPEFLPRIKRKLAQCGRRPLWILVALILMPLLVFWRPIQSQCLIHFLLRSDAPMSEVLSDVVQQTGDARSLLLRLWGTQRIPHRHFVLSHLGRIVNSEPNLFRAMEPFVVDATGDADITTRELAFAVLARMNHPQLRKLAIEQLEDADPAARLLGLQNLRSTANANEVPIAMGLLNDSDPRVVVAASLVLRKATGRDFGIRSSLALPRFTSIDNTNSTPPPDLTAINQGVQHWRDWWKDHQAEYSTSVQPSRKPRHSALLAAPDVSLADSNGRLVRLSDYRGKPVLLAFWTSDAPVSLDDVPILNAIHNRNSDGMAVLGVCIPPASGCADEHEQGNEHTHHHEAVSPALETGQARTFVQQTMQERKINYPMLLDSKGTAGGRFDVEAVPTYVLIDAQGMIRRQFVGNRTETVMRAIITEATGQKTACAETP